MLKNCMTNIRPEVVSKVSNLLASENLHLVHIAHESMIDGDDRYYVFVAADESYESAEGYLTAGYDDAEKSIFRIKNGLCYPDALIEMGQRIKE